MTPPRLVIDGSLVASLLTWSLLLVFLALIYVIMAPFMTSMGWALIIGVATFPLYRKLRSRLGGNDTKAALVMMLGVVLTIIPG
jgi:predicted PurR-regulated permease PerM